MRHVLHRVTAVVAALVVGVASAATASTAAAAEAGLSGVVTAEDGTPIAACVTVYDLGYDYAASTCTQDGLWALPELVDGSYRVHVDGEGGYIGEWVQDASSFDEAADVVAPGTVDVALSLGGVLTGTLTDAQGEPVEGASVTAHDPAILSGEETSYTGPDGDWTMVVRPGAYKVQMSNWPAEVWAFGASSFDTATTIEVAAGSTTRVDDQFEAVALVKGRITQAGTKRGVAGACATLVSLAGSPDGDTFGSACADATGAYELTAWATGTFLVRFTDPGGRFAAEYSGNSTSLRQAERVRVVAGRTARASAALDVGAVLKGRVLDADSGEGIAEVCPSAHRGRSGPYVAGQARTCTDETGAYQIGALPAAGTTVALSPRWDSGMAEVWYRGTTDRANATVVYPKVGKVTVLRDVLLEPGGTVTGMVTDGLGNPVPNVHVDLMGNYGGRSGGCENPLCGFTDESGYYSVQAPAGTYTPFFWSYEGSWAPEWSGDASTKAAATAITVESGAETSLNAVLDQGAQVTGNVVAADGSLPSDYALGLVFTEAGEYIGDFDAYDGSNWTFRSSPLPPGSFRLRVESYDEATATSTSSWFDGSTTEAGATLVTLSQGEVRDLTYHLP